MELLILLIVSPVIIFISLFLVLLWVVKQTKDTTSLEDDWSYSFVIVKKLGWRAALLFLSASTILPMMIILGAIFIPISSSKDLVMLCFGILSFFVLSLPTIIVIIQVVNNNRVFNERETDFKNKIFEKSFNLLKMTSSPSLNRYISTSNIADVIVKVLKDNDLVAQKQPMRSEYVLRSADLIVSKSPGTEVFIQNDKITIFIDRYPFEKYAMSRLINRFRFLISIGFRKQCKITKQKEIMKIIDHALTHTDWYKFDSGKLSYNSQNFIKL